MTEQLVFRSVVDLVQWSLHPLGFLTQWPPSVWDVVRSILFITFFSQCVKSYHDKDTCFLVFLLKLYLAGVQSSQEEAPLSLLWTRFLRQMLPQSGVPSHPWRRTFITRYINMRPRCLCHDMECRRLSGCATDATSITCKNLNPKLLLWLNKVVPFLIT